MADLAASLAELREQDSETLESIVDSLQAITSRLDAQATGLRLVEQKLEPSNLDGLVRMSARTVALTQPKCEHNHFASAPEDCTAFCNCLDGPVTKCQDATFKLIPRSIVLPKDQLDEAELGLEAVQIEDLMDGGHISVNEDLSFHKAQVEAESDREAFVAWAKERVAEVEAEVAGDLFERVLAQDTEDTEQALLRVVARCYHLDMAESIMAGQPGDNRPEAVGGGTRSGFVADAQSKEYETLFPLLFQWAKERGWV